MKEKKISIIIADDNENFLEAMVFLLSKNTSYNVIHSCSNGVELLEACKFNKPDIIITDLNMPVMDGVNAVKEIRELYPKIPVIALTMYYENVIIQPIIDLGFNGYIYKPHVSKRLDDVIDRVLSKKSNLIF
ncbi:response regulator [Carboxylicivirga linearis]|uniref:Response regulator transcription factor n=1 Tax=Carboxylicivirga linearis TaxID=1628157 RepID=A0ABS5JZU4_9BACT|nr:response regulator transcription factor [Carboxylicivirga linearis]MBS2100401.1 response regulator transcription factor [Carboxylicivirga linearis]